MNIIIPLTKLNNIQNEGYNYPLILTEVNGAPLLQQVINNIKSIKGETNVVFIISEIDCVNHKLDKVLKVMLPPCKVCVLKSETKGAPCSILMSTSEVNVSKPTLILNSDQYFDFDLNKHLKTLKNSKCSGGILTFNAIHPRWSTALIENNEVVQISEKNPISSNAIAGFYYFKSYKIFMEAAFLMIEMEDSVNEQYYTSLVLNQLILKNEQVKNITIKSDTYFPFYSLNRIRDFEKKKSKNE